MRRLDLQSLLDQVPFHRALGLKVRRTDGGVVLDAEVGPEYLVDVDARIVHGGVVGSLLDTAATFALIARSDHDWVTVDLRVDYLRPTHGGAIAVSGEVVRAGRSIGRAKASLRDASGETCALGFGTFAPVVSEPTG